MRWLALAWVVACSSGRSSAPSVTESIDAALARGAGFLAAQQAEDGSFRSRHYAALKDGWSLTPLPALALRMVSADPAAQASYRRAVDFLVGIAPGGRLRQKPEITYPLYGYALTALILGAPENQPHREVHAALLAGLRDLQMVDHLGWLRTDASHGGWGYAPEPSRRPDGDVAQHPLSANLSATLYAIGALTLGGVRTDDDALVSALVFVKRCQNPDGGFVFSPLLPDSNKAGVEPPDPADPGGKPRPRSYGSMSADGLRALLRLGVAPDDPALRSARAYFERVFDPARNPGDFPPAAEIRRASSYYYWAWSAGHVLRHFGDVARAEALAREVMKRQAPDGSWRNSASEMRENDPLIATAFAVAALAITRSVIARTPHHHTAVVPSAR